VRVLVTGGLGYLGSAVTRRLGTDGHDVTVLTSRANASSPVPNVVVARADLRDAAALSEVVREARPEAVCHFAALTRVRESVERPARYYAVNVGGTAALLDALGALPDPVMVSYASTGAVYGPAEGRIGEDHPTQPTNPYGASKLAAEQLIGHQAATGSIGAVVLRCFNLAGASDGVGDRDLTRIIPKALAVAAGRAELLTVNGDGSAVREFTHIKDVAAAAVSVLAAARPGTAVTYNVGSGIGSTMSQVIASVERVTGRRVAVGHRPPVSEPAILMADSARIRADLGWQPQHTSLDEIVRDAWSVA
jgi:UDP-glucose 4-epimerase